MSYANFFARSFALRGALLLSLGPFLFTSGALAQGTLLEEVIVTAQKREESLQDVPIAISALTGDQLNELGVATPNDLMNVFPNLILKPGSALNTGFSIRGVGTDNFHVTAQQAVGQYLDEVSLISPIIGSFGLFDMERVEVLRGPQNTLFGRNTTGGAVSMISRKPEVGGELNGYGRVNGGNEGRIDFEGAVGVPLGERAAARLAVQTKNRGAIYNNLLNGEDTGEEERHSGRAQLAFEPLRILPRFGQRPLHPATGRPASLQGHRSVGQPAPRGGGLIGRRRQHPRRRRRNRRRPAQSRQGPCVAPDWRTAPLSTRN